MATVRVVGDDVIIGNQKFSRKKVLNAQDAVRKSGEAASGISHPQRGINKAVKMFEHFFKNGRGTYVEVFADTPDNRGRVVCNALYDATGRPAGYIRFAIDNNRSDASLPGMTTSFYYLNKDGTITTFFTNG